MNQIDTGSGTVAYDTVRKAMDNEPFTMSLTDFNEIHAVDALNSENWLSAAETIDKSKEKCRPPF